CRGVDRYRLACDAGGRRAQRPRGCLRRASGARARASRGARLRLRPVCGERPGAERMSGVLIAAPMRLEQLLIRSAAPRARVVRTGMGPRKSQAAAAELSRARGDALLVLGFCGGLDAESVPGDVVVADDVLVAAEEDHLAERRSCDRSEGLARALGRAGLRVRTGPVVCVSRIVLGE